MTSKFSPRWRHEYTDQLRDHMSSGNSFQSFGGKIKVNNATLYFWARTYPEFRGVKEMYQKQRVKMYA